MTELEKLLSVNRINFKSWQDADIHTVTNLFSFHEQMGNSSLTEVVESLFNNKEIKSNEFLSGINYNTSSTLGLLDSIIDGYIESSLMTYDPNFLRGTSHTFTVDKCIQAHQVMLYLISLCAIRMHSSLQEMPDFSSFVNTMMNKEIVYKIVAKKQSDYGPSNVAKFGIYGLIVRTHDKIGRLRNLVECSKSNNVNDETVYDTLIDLVGYCTVSFLWINNWFLLPMDKEYIFPS